MLKLAITGHRSLSKPQMTWLKAELCDWLQRAVDRDKVIAISGMAVGVDTLWAEIVLELDVKLHAYIPFEGQSGWGRNPSGTWLKLHDRAWPEAARDHYIELLAQAEEVVDCSHTFNGHHQTPGALLYHRNRRMVDDCDYLGAAWKGASNGGTYNCLKYALAAGHRIFGFDLIDQRAGWGLWTEEDVLG